MAITSINTDIVQLSREEIKKICTKRSSVKHTSSAFSSEKGVLNIVCTCGLETKIYKDALEEALGLKEKEPDTEMVLEGEVVRNPDAGDLIFLTDNSNSHSYPLATLILYGGGNPANTGIFLSSGRLLMGNSLPPNRMYKLTRIHREMIPDNALMEKIIEVSGVEVFGRAEKMPVARKSSRSQKSKML